MLPNDNLSMSVGDPDYVWLFTARWSTWPGNHQVPFVAELVGSRIPIHAHWATVLWKKTMTTCCRFHTGTSRTVRLTERRTDRQTDRQTGRIAISISRVSVLKRDKTLNISKNCMFRFLWRTRLRFRVLASGPTSGCPPRPRWTLPSQVSLIYWIPKLPLRTPVLDPPLVVTTCSIYITLHHWDGIRPLSRTKCGYTVHIQSSFVSRYSAAAYELRLPVPELLNVSMSAPIIVM